MGLTAFNRMRRLAELQSKLRNDKVVSPQPEQVEATTEEKHSENITVEQTVHSEQIASETPKTHTVGRKRGVTNGSSKNSKE